VSSFKFFIHFCSSFFSQNLILNFSIGGSGAGKTSLLNSLCGRAHYGTTLGLIHVNGQVVEINSCVHAIGFVPQDDIVYAELTVRENLLIAGKLRLPRGTTTEYIENLADDVIADLALTRVANSIVGDVTTRGISGGEKKRVNIGLELMCKPAILFLDEPTSGLDSSSAMTVMKNLSNIVRNKGMTVCSVIHQPRKQIFEVFDSLILLGVGGKMVFHGKTSYAKEYFESLGYVMEGGEALADWMIDISSGELSPAKTSKEALNDSVFGNEVEEKIIEVHVENNVEPNEDWARFSGSFSSSNKVGFEVKYDSNPQCNSSNPILSKDFPPEDMSPLLDVDNDRVGDVAVDNRER
jgi:ABC-type multidrug transport system ATPase subunit